MNHTREEIPGLGLASCAAPGHPDEMATLASADTPYDPTFHPMPLIHTLADVQCVRSTLAQLGYTAARGMSTPHVAFLAPGPDNTLEHGPRLATRSAVGDAYGASNREPSQVWRRGDVFLLPSELPGAVGGDDLSGVPAAGFGLPGWWPRGTDSCACEGGEAGDDACVGGGTECHVDPCLDDLWQRQSGGQWQYVFPSVWAGYQDKAEWRDHSAEHVRPIVHLDVVDGSRATPCRLYANDHVPSRVLDELHGHAVSVVSPEHCLNVVRSVFAKFGAKMNHARLYVHPGTGAPVTTRAHRLGCNDTYGGGGMGCVSSCGCQVQLGGHAASHGSRAARGLPGARTR